MRPRLALLTVLCTLALGATSVVTAAEPGDAAWHEVTFDAAITSEDRRAVLDAGFDALQYWPDDSYLAHGDEEAARALATRPGVRHVRPLEAAEKLHTSLRSAEGLVTVAATVHGPALGAAEAAIPLLGEVLEVAAPIPGDDLGLVTATMPASRLLDLAARPEVVHVGPAMTDVRLLDEGASQVLAGNIATRTQIEPGYQDFLATAGVDGAGVTIAISDDGVDDNHPDLAGRLVARQATFGLSVGLDRISACTGCDRGHGTAVAGSALGAAAELPGVGAAVDADGLRYGLGAAPAATYLDMTIIRRNEPAADTSWAVEHGAVGLNGSWSYASVDPTDDIHRLGYLHPSRTMDLLVRDADPDQPGNQEFFMVFAAGNDGEVGMMQPVEAKSIVTVGATSSHRAGPVDELAVFSSRGPTADGRSFPTVVAPGDYIMGPRALPAATSCTAGGLMRPPPADGYGLYAPCSGTSFAAPRVAGGAALLHQWWTDVRGHDAGPSPAMVKALLVNSATALGTVPNNDAGWGRADLGPLLDPDRRQSVIDQDVVLTEVDQTFQLTITAADPDAPLPVTLAWTDAPGAVSADPALVNDLDLRVVTPDGAVLHGNGAPDRRNSHESLVIDDPTPGDYRVIVRAHNLPAPAVPGHPAEVNQDFALVVGNAVTDGR